MRRIDPRPPPASETSPRPLTLPAWKPVLGGALAGALGWGIRGQFGHETGAMIAGLLVGLTLTLLVCPGASSLTVIRAVAWTTVATGFGGAMTYGQTVGLTHDPGLVGHSAALAWGLLGLAIKGGLWIGFAGAFLGMGLGGVRYRLPELACLLSGLLALFFLGVAVFNSPFDPSHRVLPALYFSDHWRWEPDAELKPRREVWGGFLLALGALILYARFRRRDLLAVRLALWGVLGGALGFPLGQSLQSFHAWNLDLFRHGALARIDPLVNWWNFMETTFGAVWGGVLGFGLWRNRARIAPVETPDSVIVPPTLEWALATGHLTLLGLAEFTDLSLPSVYTEYSLLLGLLPITVIAGARLWPYLLILPVTLFPIAGKTLRALAYSEQATLSQPVAWTALAVVPMILFIAAAVHFSRRERQSLPADQTLRPVLLLATWTYFCLNTAFFRFPWPWQPWTYRTPNFLVFLACAIGLTFLAMTPRPTSRSLTA